MPSHDIPSLLTLQITLLAFGGASVFFGIQQCALRYGHALADRLLRRWLVALPLFVLVIGPIEASTRWRPDNANANVAPTWYGSAWIVAAVIALVVVLGRLLVALRPRRAAELAARGLRPRALHRQAEWERWSGRSGSFDAELKSRDWVPPISVIVSLPASNPTPDEEASREVERRAIEWPGDGDSLGARYLRPFGRRLNLKMRRRRRRLSGDQPLAPFFDLTTAALRDYDHIRWRYACDAATRAVRKNPTAEARTYVPLVDGLRLKAQQCADGPLAGKETLVIEVLVEITKRAADPHDTDDPSGAASAIASIGMGNGVRPGVARRAMHDLAALLCDRRASASVVDPCIDLARDILRRDHADRSGRDPRHGVVESLADAWEMASDDATGVAAGRVETAYSCIVVGLPVGLPGDLLERLIADYGRLGRDCAKHGWFQSAIAVAFHSGSLCDAALAMPDDGRGERTARDIAESVILMGALASAPTSPNGGQRADLAEQCVRSLRSMPSDVIDGARYEALIKHLGKDQTGLDAFLARLDSGDLPSSDGPDSI